MIFSNAAAFLAVDVSCCLEEARKGSHPLTSPPPSFLPRCIERQSCALGGANCGEKGESKRNRGNLKQEDQEGNEETVKKI